MCNILSGSTNILDARPVVLHSRSQMHAYGAGSSSDLMEDVELAHICFIPETLVFIRQASSYGGSFPSIITSSLGTNVVERTRVG